MISLGRFHRRVRDLEQRKGVRMPILHFADASTSTIRVRQPLELFCSASTMLCYFAHKRHGDRYDSEPPGSEPAVLTVSQLHQDLIRLIGRAVSIEVDDRFLVLIHGLCAEAVAAEQEPEREAIVFSTFIPGNQSGNQHRYRDYDNDTTHGSHS